MAEQDDAEVAGLRATLVNRGLTVELVRLNTRGQLAFAVPVGGMEAWRATVKRNGKRVAYGDGVTQGAAIRDALRAV